jgi:hypothetical protein
MVAQRKVCVAMVVGLVTGCASGRQAVEPQPSVQAAAPSAVTIRVVEDTVRLFRSPKGGSLGATVKVHNRSDRVLYVKRGCNPMLQRQVRAAWQTVWDNQNCLLVETSPAPLRPGDSTLVFAKFWGSSGVSPELAGWPPMDPRVEPGVYRLVLQLGSVLDRSGSAIVKLFPVDERASDPFTVHEVRRP